MVYDVITVGGGAAGLCAAIRLKQLRPQLKVAVLERLSRVGKKLITTGNGRCNITNKYITPDRYHGEDSAFGNYALKKYSGAFTEEFFSELGVLFTYDSDGKAYPYSLQASSVVDALRFSAERLGIEIITDCKVEEYSFKNGLYTVLSENNKFSAEYLILAGGLYSGGEKVGCDGALLKILKAKGYPTVKTTPAIVQLKTPTEDVRSLKGIKVNAAVRLEQNKKTVRTDSSEVLFCEYGLSGPAVMQLSRDTARGGDYTVCLDIMPEYDFQTLCEMLLRRKKALSDIKLEEFFTAMLNKRVGQHIIKLCGLKLSDSVSVLTKKDIEMLSYTIKNWRFKVTGNTGFLNSQVTAGGLSVKSFENKTMMSKREKGLFAIGEILDIDGDCGGFNLQWAWSSAFCAADAIADFYGV